MASRFHCCGLGHCCIAGSILGPEAFTYQRCGKNKQTNKKTKQKNCQTLLPKIYILLYPLHSSANTVQTQDNLLHLIQQLPNYLLAFSLVPLKSIPHPAVSDLVRPQIKSLQWLPLPYMALESHCDLPPMYVPLWAHPWTFPASDFVLSNMKLPEAS